MTGAGKLFGELPPNAIGMSNRHLNVDKSNQVSRGGSSSRMVVGSFKATNVNGRKVSQGSVVDISQSDVSMAAVPASSPRLNDHQLLPPTVSGHNNTTVVARGGEFKVSVSESTGC